MTPRLEGDAHARHLIQTALDESLIVEAAAGTGKTTELVRRIVAVLRSGRATADRIAAVTFTHKAAGELKVRLRQALDAAREGATGEELEHIEAAIKGLEEAAIGTIHALCAQILRERPVEARVDPAFEELQEAEQRVLYERAFRSWFEAALDAGAPGVRRAVTRLAWNRSATALAPSEELREAGRKLIEWRDFDAPWRREPFDRAREMRELTKTAMTLARIAALCRRPKDELANALRPICEFVQWVERSKVRRSPDYDAVEAQLLKLLRDLKRFKNKGRGPFADGITREQLVRQRDAFVEELERFKIRADADLAAQLRDDVTDLCARYEELKRRAGKLDFIDLLIKTRNLVRDSVEVRRFLQTRFTHLFVDEFQDTDPIQAEIFLLLASDDVCETDWRNATPKPGKLFLVGDPKQAIYKFRRADVLLYQDVRDRLKEKGVRVLHLTHSYRALRPIQQCINAAFEPLMQESRDSGQAGYVPLEGCREPIDAQPCVIALPAPYPLGGAGRVTNKAIDACLPDAVGAFVEMLLASGWKVRTPGSDELVPIAPHHIAILFRRRVNYGNDITRPYVRNLEARGIPHLLVGSRSFHQREEVETLRTACAAIEHPDDELAVFATLRGSLFAIPDHILFRYREETGLPLHPLRPAGGELPADLALAASALEHLRDLHRARNQRPVADSITRLLETTRAHAGFALRPGGHQVLANVLRVAELARSFEAYGGVSFRAFVDELYDRAAAADATEPPLVEEAAEGVRLMTVHTAKGLEFPVVILADTTAKLSAGEADRYIDPDRRLCATRLLRCAPWDLLEHEAAEKAREDAEGVRVAYVAATRARDLLVTPAVGDQECDGWVAPLNSAIYPPPQRFRQARPAPGCPVKGDRTVLPFSGSHEGAESVMPGLHTPRRGEHHVVWWDPAALRLKVEGKLGLADHAILTGDAGESLNAYAAWRDERSRVNEAGAAPQRILFRPSEAVEDPPGPPLPVHVHSTPKTPDRPKGPRFGGLVHAVLRDSRLDTGIEDPIAAAHGRTLGATADEIEAAGEAVRAALAHPLLDRARRSGRAYFEAPVSLEFNGKYLEGSIDLVFIEDGAWYVVDFKTDADGGRLRHYESQLRWYALALSRLTSAPIELHLLNI
jgi:ATP-dependent helicase/nuclease subunit A